MRLKASREVCGAIAFKRRVWLRRAPPRFPAAIAPPAGVPYRWVQREVPREREKEALAIASDLAVGAQSDAFAAPARILALIAIVIGLAGVSAPYAPPGVRCSVPRPSYILSAGGVWRGNVNEK